MRALKTTLAAVAALLVVGAALLWWWLPSDAALAQRVAEQASRALGVQVRVGALEWQLLPHAQVTVHDVATAQEQPIVLRRLLVQPRLWPLLLGRVELQRVALDGATVVQQSLRALGGGGAKAGAPAVELARLEFSDVTWVSYSGVAVAYSGEADIDPGLRLREARLWRPGQEPPADLHIVRDTADAQDATQRFSLQARVGGGAAQGQARVLVQDGGRLRLEGELTPRGVEVQAALAAFHRDAPVGGRADGETRFAAEGDNPLALAQTLRTETRFTMQPATVLRFDLDRAIETLGREHAGQTRLDRLTGGVETQNTPAQGMVIRFIDIKAEAGRLSASGSAVLQRRQLQATAAIDLVDGVVGVPMRIEGPLGQLKVTVSKAPLVGAAAGTAVLPGIGTAIGAAIGRLFGGDEAPPPKAAPAPRH
ncbi:AsmA-like C-terminal region-containing protein [Pseudorhodoferax sp. Leaf274]|uniref:AsmA-like C-terminal region-containing protein n=1 Tax=Pseudorhodoferax sp. Leaf274 TaxID=1736318 RepID=UPI00070253D0|nr:AsmA-like C-terminal region-containing protein [Pseudorhodoferax sp. Leaf274]KQP49569.1 hypothetical protein ASF44_02955 [Pseudorhodoferax sp. Leaf274]